MIGDRIKSARTAAGYSQTELAEMIRVSKQTLYKYENNIITNVPSDKIEHIALVCGVSPAYLMGWDSAPAAGPATTEDLSREALVIARAYDAADEGTKNSVAKLLDVKREVSGSEEGALYA